LSIGCSSVQQHLCCQIGKKKHLSAPVRRHILVTEFPYPGWGFNPFNWDLGGMWTVQYRYVCGHEMSSPGCRYFYPCCQRFEGFLLKKFFSCVKSCSTKKVGWHKNIPHICHGRHGRRPCNFFLAGVNFYQFNAKNWQFTV